MRPPLLAAYWRAEQRIVNLGDYLTEVFLAKFGYEFLSCERAAREGRSEEFAACLFLAGSLLDADWCRRVKMRKSVWGSGDWGDARLTAGDLRACTIHAVRGPLTVQRLGLPDSTPLGDPALLLPLLFPLQRQGDSGIIYVAHFHARDTLDAPALAALGASRLVETAHPREDFGTRLQSIVDAEFVLTGSLHGAIIAAAYGRPWALCLPPGRRQDKPGKWQDWFAWLGLEPALCRDSAEAARWWREKGRHGIVRDLGPLMRALPFPILDPATRRIWEAHSQP